MRWDSETTFLSGDCIFPFAESDSSLSLRNFEATSDSAAEEYPDPLDAPVTANFKAEPSLSSNDPAIIFESIWRTDAKKSKVKEFKILQYFLTDRDFGKSD